MAGVDKWKDGRQCVSLSGLIQSSRWARFNGHISTANHEISFCVLWVE
jgi:hypothetical protein